MKKISIIYSKLVNNPFNYVKASDRISAYAVYLHCFDEQEIVDIRLLTHPIRTGLLGRSRAFRPKFDLSRLT